MSAVEGSPTQALSCFDCTSFAQKVNTDHRWSPPRDFSIEACLNPKIAALASFSTAANTVNADNYIRLSVVRHDEALPPTDKGSDEHTEALRQVGEHALEFFMETAYPVNTPASCPFFVDRHGNE